MDGILTFPPTKSCAVCSVGESVHQCPQCTYCVCSICLTDEECCPHCQLPLHTQLSNAATNPTTTNSSFISLSSMLPQFPSTMHVGMENSFLPSTPFDRHFTQDDDQASQSSQGSLTSLDGQPSPIHQFALLDDRSVIVLKADGTASVLTSDNYEEFQFFQYFIQLHDYHPISKFILHRALS